MSEFRWEAIVVDNASEVGFQRVINDVSPRTHVISNAENLGFARAANQGIEKANATNVEYVKNAMQGMTVQTTRGKLYFRKIDNQLSCSAYFGRVADDPAYKFPIYHDLQEFKGPDIWRPEQEIRAARE